MAAHCSFVLSSMAFPTVCALYWSADVRALLILPLVNSFSDGSRAVLLSGWQRIAHSSARQQLFRRFARRIAQRLAAYCLFLHSLMAFPTVRTPYCSVDGSALLICSLVNGFSDGVRAVLVRGCKGIAHSSARQQLFRRFARRIAQRMAAHCHSFCHQRLSRQIARRIVPRVAADGSYLCLSTAFLTVCAPYCSVDGSGLLILLLANGFYDGLHTVLLRGWQRIAHSSACQWLSRPFARHMSQRMASDCSFFRSSTAFAVCAPFCPANGSGFLLLAVVNGFQYGLRTVLPCGW